MSPLNGACTEVWFEYWQFGTAAKYAVYASVWRPSVCLSVPANFAAVARPAGDIDRLQRVNAGSATLSAYVGLV